MPSTRASNPNGNPTLLELLFPSPPSVSPSLPYAADGKADSRNRITSPVSAGIDKAAIAEQIVILVVPRSGPVADLDPAHGKITGSPVTIPGYRIPRRCRNRDFDRPITSHVGIHSGPSTVVYRELYPRILRVIGRSAFRHPPPRRAGVEVVSAVPLGSRPGYLPFPTYPWLSIYHDVPPKPGATMR